ncbi:MAG TPA: phospholipid carrier-dependent glycosyltransferase [Anaerolineae bacterium]|nr:phospholipid carrier-dependent glycosyltransferase [Anaerolineae bacterium]
MTRRRPLALILAAYFVLGGVYSLATPVLEASDEFKHYPYVQYVQTHHDLPVLNPETCLQTPDDCPWLQDGGQPPLYYITMAAATSWIDTSDLRDLRWMNWHAFIGDPAQVCNKNLVIHLPERERFPWHGSVLAIHLIRFLTLGFGAGTVVLTYLLARDLFPGEGEGRGGAPSSPRYVALGAAVLTAFNPMFLFVSGAVNNDAMAAFMGNLALLMMVRIADPRRQIAGRRLVGRVLALGVVVGLGMLTKLSLLALLPLVLLVVALRVWRQRSSLSIPRCLGFVVGHWSLIILTALLISGWWFLRNWRLYGDPTALNVFVAIQGVRTGVPTLRDWLGEFGTFRWTYWGLFGAVDVMAPRWVYAFFDLLSLAGLAGLMLWIARRGDPTPRPSFLATRNSLWWIPALWVAVLFISVLRWTWVYFSFQGRLMFPGVAGISALLMVGLQQWTASRFRPALTAGVALVMFAIAVVTPFVSILPAYVPPEPLALSDVPLDARVEPVDVGGGMRLVGLELPPQSVARGGSVEVVVYWEAVAPDGGDYVSFARLLGRGMDWVGDVNRRPACGMVPTSLWRPGQVWRDPYRVEVAEDAAAPSRLRVEVGLYDPKTGRTLGVVAVGEAKLAPPAAVAEPAHPLTVELADGVTLRGYDLAPEVAAPGEVVTLTLYWEAREAPAVDYQVFVHLLGEGLEPVAQGDAPPLGGDYPTGLWAPGEVIVDPHPLLLPEDLPPGRYRLSVGMYDLETMARLARLDGSGDAIELPTPLDVH